MVLLEINGRGGGVCKHAFPGNLFKTQTGSTRMFIVVGQAADPFL